MDESTHTILQRTPEEIEANTKKLLAEARKAEAEADRLEEEKLEQQVITERAVIGLARVREEEAVRLSDDDHNLVYRFLDQVSDTSAQKAINKLTEWSRLRPGEPITIIFDSPGGAIIDGFHLFDTILELRHKGHYVTTIAQGMAASMAGILLQAGDHRVMTKQATLLIHEAQFAAMGSYGKIEDIVDFIKKLQNRILEIFAERSNLSAKQIENRWHRKDWWMLADEALDLGFCDEVRGL